MLAKRRPKHIAMAMASASTRLLQAASSGDAAGVAMALAKGGQASVERSGLSAVHAAAAAGHASTIRAMSAGGAELDARSSVVVGGGTPLHLAIRNRQPEAARALIEGGADIDAVELGEWAGVHERNAATWRACTGTGKTPLILAAELGLLSVASLLLASGCDEERTDADGFNAGHWAKANGHTTFFSLPGAPEARKPAHEELVAKMMLERAALAALGPPKKGGGAKKGGVSKKKKR
jgi:hypothetical protein